MSLTYQVTVTHGWTAIVEADSEDEAREQAITLDENIPCNQPEVEVVVEVAS